jgi:hypothetical protein
MAEEKKKPKLAELISNKRDEVVSSNDTVLNLLNHNKSPASSFSSFSAAPQLPLPTPIQL